MLAGRAGLAGSTDGAGAAAVPRAAQVLDLGRGAAHLDPSDIARQHADLQGV